MSVKFRDYSFIGYQEIRFVDELGYRCGHCARSVIFTVSRDLRVEGQKRPHIWNHWPQFVYLLYNFYGATMTINCSLLLRVPIATDFRFVYFRQKSTFGALNRRLIFPMLLAIALTLLRQVCDLHFKFEEDRTKTAVAIERDRYSYRQTQTSNDFKRCPVTWIALDRQN